MVLDSSSIFKKSISDLIKIFIIVLLLFHSNFYFIMNFG